MQVTTTGNLPTSFVCIIFILSIIIKVTLPSVSLHVPSQALILAVFSRSLSLPYSASMGLMEAGPLSSMCLVSMRLTQINILATLLSELPVIDLCI